MLKVVTSYWLDAKHYDSLRVEICGRQRLVASDRRVCGSTSVFICVFVYLTMCFLSSLLLSNSTRKRFYPVSDLLDKPWSQMSSLLPRGVCRHFMTYRVQISLGQRVGFSSPPC